MKQVNIFSLSKPASYINLILWAGLILFAGKFVFNNALPYFGFEEEAFGRWWNYKWTLIGHISGGLLALTVGPFQFWKAFRNKYMTAHRWSGRIYLSAILIGTISSSYLAWTTGLKVNLNWAVALQGLAFVWIITAAMAYISVRRGNIQQHKDWMIKSYVVTFAFVSFRWLNELPALEELSGSTLIWMSWAIPLMITEIFLQWERR
jgi:uncharacterized membrane protein